MGCLSCHSLLQRSCLKQNYSLRRQLFLSFGFSAFLTLSVVVIISCVAVHNAGVLVRDQAGEVMRDQVYANIMDTTQSVADIFTQYIRNIEGMTQLIAEMTQDRITGYPLEGWEEDRFVPFRDMETNTNIYPLRAQPLPIHWNISFDLTEENAFEMMQERESWVPVVGKLFSASSGSYYMQGACDPTVTDPSSSFFLNNCTEANNNAETGGVIRPTPTNKGLYKKAAELAVLVRPLFEFHRDVLQVGIYFQNSGAGSAVQYPGMMMTFEEPYISQGCEWMRKTNPFSGLPYGTEEEIQRCHPKGTMVYQHEYNALEREWYQGFIVNEGRVHTSMPYKALETGVFLLSIGKAVYDRRTGHLIGCVSVDIAMADLNDNLASSRLLEHSEFGLFTLDGSPLADTVGSVTRTEIDSTRWQDLGLFSSEKFQEMSSIVVSTFDGNWTPELSSETLIKTLRSCTNGYAVAYPIPVPPDSYHPDYTPIALVVQAISYEVFHPIDELEQYVKQDVINMAFLSAGIGVAGMVILLIIVWCVSRVLTQPLIWMESISWRIVNHADERSGRALHVDEEDDLNATVRFSPNTEITQLVAEFRKMIQGFSGDGASSVAQSELNEFPNDLTWQSDFHQLYAKKEDTRQSIRSNLSFTTPVTEDSSGRSRDPNGPAAPQELNVKSSESPGLNSVYPAPPKQNYGRNLEFDKRERRGVALDDNIRMWRSPIFRWIVVLIFIPLLLANLIICVVVTQEMLTIGPEWVDTLKQESRSLSVEALESITASKATLVWKTLFEPIRDLHLMARIYSWIYADALPRSDAFTVVNEATEECKFFGQYECPFFETERTVCPCDWADPPSTGVCDVLNDSDTRSLQTRYVAALAQDADPLSGARINVTSFPAFGSVPNSTVWWRNFSAMPGSFKGANASGYSTSYDRLRVASAFAVVDFPLFNYHTSLGRPKHHLGTFMAYESDGMFTGFNGCSFSYGNYAHFRSSEANRAAEIAPHLCPQDKYGFDPRCRAWYDATKKQHVLTGGTQSVHLTPPYQFAITGEIGLSVAAAIIDQQKNEFIGEALLDFVPMGLKKNFYIERRSPLSILITPDEDDIFGGDTVIGPDKTTGFKSAPIGDLLFLHDAEDSSRRRDFETRILPKMKNGDRAVEQFSRTLKDGSTEELTMAFSPVHARFLRPLNSTDLSRGVAVSEGFIYSIGIAYSAEALRAPFEEAKGDLTKDINTIAIINIAAVVFISLLFTLYTCKIAIYITKPMIVLLKVVQNINSGETESGIPPLTGGSREVFQVYNSFSKLYKIVRVSNTAFFSGNLQWAYHFISDALELFRKVEDEKAIGIACNNIGNTLFAMSVTRNESGDNNQTFVSICIPRTALDHYNEAVEIGQRAFESEEMINEQKANLALQLADRLFNRGLYLLFINDEASAPENPREMALIDIRKARDLDNDVKDFWIDQKILLENSEDYFMRLLRRIHGLSEFYTDDELRGILDARALVDDADRLLFAAWNEPSAPLFDTVTRVGRLQQLESAAIKMELNAGNHREAARLAMRMFSEDEYLIEGAFTNAGTALLRHVRESEPWTPMTVSSLRADFRSMLRSCRNASLDMGKCLIYSIELNERWEGGQVMDRVNHHCLSMFDDNCDKEDFVGVAAYTVRGDQNLVLGRKADNSGRQRATLDLATTSTSESVCPALPFALQMIVDSSASIDKDTYVLLITDGFSWDTDSYMSIKWQMERMNRSRNTTIHMIIIGLDIEDEEVVEQCRAMTSLSKASMFIELFESNVDAVFSTVAGVISAHDVSEDLQGMTMEKF